MNISEQSAASVFRVEEYAMWGTTVQIPRYLYNPSEEVHQPIFAITFPTLNFLPPLSTVSSHKNIVSSLLPSKLTGMELRSNKHAGFPENMVRGK
jgi:hypothetical protein